MSQNDFVIANQTAPAFRADLNSALQALASVSSGATEPATKYANMLWYDTGTNILKKRNEANSAWINMGTFNEGTGTFTPTGTPPVQTQTTWNTGTGTTESVISPVKLDDKIENKLNASGTAPMYACRAWVNFDGTGTPSIRASGNVSSITDLGTGKYRVNFSTAMSDANYAVVVTATRSGFDYTHGSVPGTVSKTASSVAVNAFTPGGTMNPIDVEIVNVAIFR